MLTSTIRHLPAARGHSSGLHTLTYRLVRVGANESKQLPKQDAVSGLVPAVFDGQ